MRFRSRCSSAAVLRMLSSYRAGMGISSRRVVTGSLPGSRSERSDGLAAVFAELAGGEGAGSVEPEDGDGDVEE